MGRRASAASVTLLLVAAWLPTPALAPAQTDLAKVLVGSWKGEVKRQYERTENPPLTLLITTVKQDGGKWSAEGRLGAAADGKTIPVKIEIDPDGSKPSLRWTGASGAIYNVSLFDDRNLVGSVTMTIEQAKGRARERSVKLEKQ